MSTDKVDAFLEKLAALGGEILDAAKPALEVATDAALTAVQFNGMFGLVTGGAAAVIAAGTAVACWKSAVYVGRARYDDPLEIPMLVTSLVAGGAAFCASIVAVVNLGSAYTWMALFRPDAYLAAKALGL